MSETVGPPTRTVKSRRSPRRRGRPRPSAAVPRRVADVEALRRARRAEARAQHREQRGVVAVARLPRDDAAANRPAEQIEVADDVEDLVAHELVLEAQRRIHDALVADEDEVVEPAAGGEAHALERLDLLHEPERARRRDLARERLRTVEAERVLLAADRRGVLEEIAHLEPVARLDRDALPGGVVGADRVAAVDHELLHRRVLLGGAAVGEQLAELLRG